MISEKIVSDKFITTWKQHFPLIGPRFAKLLNNRAIKINTIQIESKNNIRYDLISELAFKLAKHAIENNIPLNEDSKDKNLEENLVLDTINSLNLEKLENEKKINITAKEKIEYNLIANNIIEFINNEANQNCDVLFSPKIKGYGIIPDLTADLSINKKLFEIKSIQKNFGTRELKQLLVYLSLGKIGGQHNWENAGIYNPRKGILYEFNIEELVFELSGGKSSFEVFLNFLNDFEREIILDSTF